MLSQSLALQSEATASHFTERSTDRGGADTVSKGTGAPQQRAIGGPMRNKTKQDFDSKKFKKAKK